MPLASVESCLSIGDNRYLLQIKTPWLDDVQPGQFVHLRLPDQVSDPLLRRPFSVHYFNRNKKTLHILFQVAGRVTGMMSALKKGDNVDILAPLGRGFDLPDTDNENYNGKVLIAAGGIGMAPLFYLAMVLADKKISFDFLVGSSTGKEIPSVAYFQEYGIVPVIATDDGSAGYHGFVTELIQEHISRQKEIDLIYACGPIPMLKEVVRIAEQEKIKAQVSLESVMACGVGACLGCACGVRRPSEGNKRQDDAEAASPESLYACVCREGPVFFGDEVVFPDE